jgi:DNA modification methylase
LDKLLNEDCLVTMKRLPDNCIDAVVTDPPYGISFMNKKWDYDIPSVDIWKEALRILKPGAHMLVACGTRTQHRMTTNIEDAGFEVRDIIVWAYGCLSEDTEVLTHNGWKDYKNLNTEDNILQWNKFNNILSWSKPKGVFEYEVNDDMVLLENRHTSQLLTQNHSVVAKIRKHNRNPKPIHFDTIKAGEIKSKYQIDLPLAGNLIEGKDVKYPYLVGWWLTDAWKHGDGKAVMFSQSKKQTLNKLRDFLDNIGAKYSEYIKTRINENHQDEHTFYVTEDIAEYLLNNWQDRELNWDMLLWNQKSRYDLLEGLLDGDGSRSKTRGYSEVFWSKKSHRLDIVQALCLSLNIRSHIDYQKGCVYLNRNHNTTQIQYKHKKPIQPYTGIVWCLQTETGAFAVRRNGRAFITGNSGFPKSLNISKAIDKELGCEREVVATHNKGAANKPNGNSFDDDNYVWSRTVDITSPSSDLAKQYDGYGTALKPAWEAFSLFTKPIDDLTILKDIISCLLKSLALIVAKSSQLNLREPNEGVNIAQWIAEKNINIPEDLLEVTDMLQLELVTTSNLNIVLSWLTILADLWRVESISTISTATGLTTELTILKSMEWENILGNIILPKNNQTETLTANVCDVVSLFNVLELLLRNTPSLTAQENASLVLKDLKPSVELFTLFRKPLSESTIAKNVMKHGTGGINVDGCRVGSEITQTCIKDLSEAHGNQFGKPGIKYPTIGFKDNLPGRFPANLIHDGSQEILDLFPNTGSGNNKQPYSYKGREYNNKDTSMFNGDKPEAPSNYNDYSSASRFFYCAKASKSERNANVEGTNNHPTVKPISLMRYLCRLITPPDGIVYDPFTGSGSTLVAAIQEGFHYLGSELDEKYCEIARHRINHAKNKVEKEIE